MKAIVNTGPDKLEWLDRPAPQPGPGQVRVRVAACGIWATDLEMIQGWSRTGFPAIPGHEWSGVVDAVAPGGDARLVGRLCVAENVLADGGEVGFEHPGGYGQFLLTEAANVRVLPPDFPAEQAALIEPLAVCVRARRRLGPRPGDWALVLGDGVIGLLMLALLKRAGAAAVTLVGGRAIRLVLARELGADAVVNYHDFDHGLSRLRRADGIGGRASNAAIPGRAPGPGRAVRGQECPRYRHNATGPNALAKAVAAACGRPPANVIEASGSPAAIKMALAAAAKEGKVLVIGDYGRARAGFAWNTLLHRELELIGSNASAGAWDEAVLLATSGEAPLGRLITRRLPAPRFAEAFDLVRSGREVVKVVLDWSEEPP